MSDDKRNLSALPLEDRIVELEDAIRDMLDFSTRWTRPMSDAERLKFITERGYQALKIEGGPDA